MDETMKGKNGVRINERMKVKKGLGLNQCKMKRKKGNKGWMYERMNAWKDKWKEERK